MHAEQVVNLEVSLRICNLLFLFDLMQALYIITTVMMMINSRVRSTIAPPTPPNTASFVSSIRVLLF